MVKPEWGTKRSCPKCGTRFYDLGKDDPVTCISCGYAWEPEPILKSKQPLPFEAPSRKRSTKDDDRSGDDEDLDIGEDEEPSRRRRGRSGRRRRSRRRYRRHERRKLIDFEPRGRALIYGAALKPRQGRASQGRAFAKSGRWGRSSAGRALQWHCRGQGFDPPRLHHSSLFCVSVSLRPCFREPGTPDPSLSFRPNIFWRKRDLVAGPGGGRGGDGDAGGGASPPRCTNL